MIDLKECIRFCIEKFDSEEATKRLFNFINESIELKQKEIELINSINVPDVLKETTIDYLKKTIRAIYSCDYNSHDGKFIISVDSSELSDKEKKLIDRFKEYNNMYSFVFVNRIKSNNYCNGRS